MPVSFTDSKPCRGKEGTHYTKVSSNTFVQQLGAFPYGLVTSACGLKEDRA